MANTRVLMIEDHLFWGDILVESLTKRGYSVLASPLGGASILKPSGMLESLAGSCSTA